MIMYAFLVAFTNTHRTKLNVIPNFLYTVELQLAIRGQDWINDR